MNIDVPAGVGAPHSTHNTPNTRSQPCRPDRSWQVAGQGGATTHEHTRPTLPARPHSAGRQSGRSHNTHTCGQPCRPERTRQVASQGGATAHEHTRPTLPARPHSAGRRSGRSRNTGICDQLCRPRPVREEPQYTYMRPTLLTRPYTQSVYVVQAHLSGCNLHPKHYKSLQLYPE